MFRHSLELVVSLVKSTGVDLWHSFFNVYPASSTRLPPLLLLSFDALPPSLKKSLDQVSDILKILAGLQESG